MKTRLTLDEKELKQCHKALLGRREFLCCRMRVQRHQANADEKSMKEFGDVTNEFLEVDTLVERFTKLVMLTD